MQEMDRNDAIDFIDKALAETLSVNAGLDEESFKMGVITTLKNLEIIDTGTIADLLMYYDITL